MRCVRWFVLSDLLLAALGATPGLASPDQIKSNQISLSHTHTSGGKTHKKQEGWFTFMLIAYTQKHVIIPKKQIGDKVCIVWCVFLGGIRGCYICNPLCPLAGMHAHAHISKSQSPPNFHSSIHSFIKHTHTHTQNHCIFACLSTSHATTTGEPGGGRAGQVRGAVRGPRHRPAQGGGRGAAGAGGGAGEGRGQIEGGSGLGVLLVLGWCVWL